MSQTKEEYDKARTMSAAALRRLAVGYIWNIVPQGKQAIVLSEGVFPLPKGDQITDYLIIEDGLDDERRATRFLEKCGARCAERGRMIFWTRRRFWGRAFVKFRRQLSRPLRFSEQSDTQVKGLLQKSGWVLVHRRSGLLSGLAAAVA